MRELYICGSPYQAMNVLNIVHHKHDSAEKTLFIVNQFREAENVANKIKETKLFDNVYVLQWCETSSIPFGIKHYILAAFDYLMPLYSLKIRLKDCKDIKAETFVNSFDVVYEVGVSHLVAAIMKLNPNAEFILYDEGTGNYSGDVVIGNRNKLKLLFCKIFNVGPYVCRPSKLLVNNVKLCRSTSVPSNRIFPLPEIDDGFKELCRNIFDMDTVWKDYVLWLSQPLDFIDGAAEAREEVRSCLLPYRDKITIRMHYRDSDYEFYRYFNIDDGRCAWELLLMNAGKKVNDLIPISGYSSAQITPKILFDMEPVLIFLHHFNRMESEEQKGRIDLMIDDMRKTYRNPEKIYNPKTAEELSIILQKLIL